MFDVYSSTHAVDVSGVKVVFADHGPEDGIPVVLIHGWPDTANLWRHQIPELIDAGYRVLAPDLRGFGRSDQPQEVSSYAVATMASDVAAVIDASGLESAHIVGHDWGAGISWYLAIAMRERIKTLTALSVGHPTAFATAGLRQLEKSWYMLLFQALDIAEEWLASNEWENFRSFVGHHSEVESWIENLERPGALTASLGLYRANTGPQRLIGEPRQLPTVTSPVMGIWSAGDMALTERQMTESANYVSGEFRYQRIENASHWIPLDEPDQLNALLLDWLGSH